MKIGFIGTGNMGGAILKGYAKSQDSRGNELFICNRTDARNQAVAEAVAKAGREVAICNSPTELAEKSDIIIIGVKPAGVPEVLREISPVVNRIEGSDNAEHVAADCSLSGSKLIVSMAAGVSIRAMEAAVKSGNTGISESDTHETGINLSEERKAQRTEAGELPCGQREEIRRGQGEELRYNVESNGESNAENSEKPGKNSANDPGGSEENYNATRPKLMRIMPNTPAQVGEAMTSISRNEAVTDEELAAAKAIFDSVGRCEEVPEDMIDCVIGVSGSSPAYTYMYMEALAQAAVDNGMEQKKARAFAAQAVLGAAKMALESEESLEQLRVNVCSPGGTTIEAVNRLFDNGFMENVKEGFQAAVDRSKEMAGRK